MRRWSAALLCAAAFVSGVAIGTLNGPWLPDALAQVADLGAVERVYSELQTGRSPLQDSSDLLAKIARLTTNSVVHIQSERKTERGKLVEETGSGVIVESAKAKGFFVVSNRHVVDRT